jgi:hypothetical protein
MRFPAQEAQKWNFKNCSEEIGDTPSEGVALTEVKVRKIIVVTPGT